MPAVELALAAVHDLDELIQTRSLPPDTRARVAHSLRPLSQFPRLGQPLTGHWEGYRLIVGPWRWLLIVYVHIDVEDRVVVVTIQDARSSTAVTSQQGE